MRHQKPKLGFILLFIVLVAGLDAMAQHSTPAGGDLMSISPVTDNILMVHIRDGHIDTYGIDQNISHNRVYHDPTDLDKALNKANYSITSKDDNNYSSPLNPVNIGRKSKGWEYQDVWNPPPYIWQHWIYIELPHTMLQGHTYTVKLDNITGNRNSLTFVFDVNSIRSETVRVNMVGFPENGPKFAYLSHWMGDFNTEKHPEGGLTLDDKAGNEFRVIDFSTGDTVFTGAIAKRMDKNTRETGSDDFPGGNYTNAYVWECDFSAFTTPGEYVVAVDGIGRSFPFEIGNDITREAYYYAMKGLFWQRQGIVLEVEPDSIRPRGHHPDDIVWRFDPGWHGQGYDVSGFNTDSPRVHGVWGHYYDAGDWDGYVSHNRVPAHLLFLYDLAPEGFHDGDVGNRYKLNEGGEWIEEGESGKPDLLDEAVWLLDYNRRARHVLKDYGGTGGVPGYVGRDAIPSGNTVTAWMDTREWYISGNNPEATFLYAGNAAYYAMNLNRFHELEGGTGNHPEYEEWMTEAVASYDWADANTSGSDSERRAQGYAAAVLYRATGETAYQTFFRDYWVWEPHKTDGEWAGVNLWAISAMQLAMLPDEHSGLNAELRNSCRNSIITRADSKAGDIFSNGFRNGMEYYQFMQLGGFNTPRLTVLGAAHRLTGDHSYLEAMQHAVSYVLGGNQLNMTYLSGLGERSDQWIFQPNAYLVSNNNSKVYTPESYIGQTSYFGATGLASNYWFTQSKFAEYFSREAAYPPAADPPSDWPGAEQRFQNRYSIQGGEFTIHQQMNHMIFAMGYVNAMANTSDTPYTLAPRPELSLNLTDGEVFPRSGSYLTVNASENTRKIEYYQGWRLIGESSDRENDFRILWRPDQEDGIEVLMTAVAYSDRGRRSLPSAAGERRVIVSGDVGSDDNDSSSVPETSDSYRLYQNWPNPFNSSTSIRFDLPHQSSVTFRIFDMSGRKLATMVDETKSAGEHTLFLANHSFAQPRIIFDTDHGGDADDLGALVMLHNLHNMGECELLAIMSWSTEQYVIPAMDAVNRYYGNPGIPMGIRHRDYHHTDWNYNKPIADNLSWELTNDDVPPAVDLYRKILSEQEDNSVTIVTVGPLKNIKDLLMSEPDNFSDLAGYELIEKKVKKFVIMGGRFPVGDWEWNFSGDMPGVTRYVLENLTAPIVFSGFEIGSQIMTGERFNELDPGHPLYIGYKHFSKHAPWMEERYREGRISDNASYDQTAVLFAVRGGVGKYWEKVENGYCVADDGGGNLWVESDEPTNHAYLVLKKSPEEMSQIIYSLKIEDAGEYTRGHRNHRRGNQ